MLFLKKLFAKDGIDGRETSLSSPNFFDEARNNIYPWIKVTYPFTRENCRDSVKQLFESANMPVFQFWLDDLCIFYAVERKDRYEFLLQKDLPKGISIEDVHGMAFRNLNRDVSFELGQAPFGGYALMSGGDHESTAICLPHAEKDVDSVSNMKIFIHEHFKKGDHLLSRNIFRVDRSNLEWKVIGSVGKGK